LSAPESLGTRQPSTNSSRIPTKSSRLTI
jgi:hypothetical protein